jgi:hypothetical protein
LWSIGFVKSPASIFEQPAPGERQTKSQIPSTKLQINLKFQYPMTKTTTAIAPYNCPNLYPTVMMLFGPDAGGSQFGILNLGHWSLFGFWCL